MSHHKEQRGFLTIARNSQNTNYLELAYAQALSVKLTQKNNSVALLSDKNTLNAIEPKHEKVFDYIIELPEDSNYNSDTDFKFYNDHHALRLTPFKETFKLESDILLTQYIDHWIHGLRKTTNLYFPTHCSDYRGELVTDTISRDVLIKNKLPNIYSGFMYYRYSMELVEFFELCQHIVEHWDSYKTQYYGLTENYPSNDVLYAIACQLYGVEKTTVPTLSTHYHFMHGKPSVHSIREGDNLYDTLHLEFDVPQVRIGGLAQYKPVHYYTKIVITPEVIKEYENAYNDKISNKTRRRRKNTVTK